MADDGKTRELSVSLAQVYGVKPTIEPFCIVGDGHASIGDREKLKAEGAALADLLFDSLPGGTVVAMVQQLRTRYAKLSPLLDPFRDA